MSRFFVCCAMLTLATAAMSQEFSFGFKTGLSFNNIKGELEKSATAEESLDRNVGFHFGASFAWEMSELMGLRGEFLYSQKGTKRSFEGEDSYYNLITDDDDIVRLTGLRKQELNVSNTYLEFPVTFYVKPHSRFEVYGGASFGLLVSSGAFGNVSISNIGNAVPDAIDHELDFNYLADKPGEFTLDNPASTIKINNNNYPYPQTAGAYFEFKEDRGKLYKAIDLGLVGGVSVYLSKSLYLSGRINYGLVDITKSKADVSLSALDANKEFISRNDDDRNISTQLSIGFSF